MSDTFEELKKSLGHQVTEVVYQIRGEVGRVLLLGAYPPSNADERRQHDNPTSREFAKVFGSFAFDWLNPAIGPKPGLTPISRFPSGPAGKKKKHSPWFRASSGRILIDLSRRWRLSSQLSRHLV